MIYTVKRIDEDLDFGCEERAADAPVMAVVTLVDEAGNEMRVKQVDAMLYERDINEGDLVYFDENDQLWDTGTGPLSQNMGHRDGSAVPKEESK